MSATAIDQLLISIGFEVDDQEAKEAETMMGSLADEALKLGAVLAGGLGLDALTFGFAESADRMAKFARLNGIAVEEVDKLSYALQREGGTAEDAYNELNNMNNILGRLQAGDYGWTTELSRFGFDPAALQQATTLAEMMDAIAKQYQNLNAQQRMQVGNILGLGDATRNLFMQGPGARANYNKELERRGVINTGETDAAEGFNDAVLNLQMSVRGFTKELSEVLLVKLASSINGLDEVILKNKGSVFNFFDEYSDEIEDSFVGAAIIGAAALGTKLFKALGGLPSILMSYVVGNLAGMWDWDRDKVSEELGIDFPEWMFKPIDELTKEDVFGAKSEALKTTKLEDYKSPTSFKYGAPVASERQIQTTNNQTSVYGYMAQQQQGTPDVNVTNHFTINEATNASATAQKVSEDIKASTTNAMKKLGGNVQ